MTRPALSLLLLGLMALPLTAAPTPAPWLASLDAARKASAASGLPILVDVTRSDGALPCEQMEAEVFSQPDFLPAVQTKFVLLRLDYPQQGPQTERLRVQNQKFAEAYPFDGFPTWFVLDAGGRVSGKHTGFVAGGVAAFVELVNGLAAQAGPLHSLEAAVAKAAPGQDRARAQDALFRQAQAWGIEFQYGDLPLKIVQEDRDGKAGLKARYQTLNAYLRLVATWAAQGNDRKAADDFDQLAQKAQAWPDLAQRILFTAGMVRWNALDDEVGARDRFRQARDLAPDSEVGRKASGFLDRLP